MTKEAMTQAREALHKELLHEAEQIIDFLIKRLPVSDDRNAEIAAFTLWKLKMRGEKPWMEPLDALATAALAQPSDEARDAARYRWLRENCRGGQEDTKEPQLIHASDPMDGSSWREWLDAAIDAALQAKDGAR